MNFLKLGTYHEGFKTHSIEGHLMINRVVLEYPKFSYSDISTKDVLVPENGVIEIKYSAKTTKFTCEKVWGDKMYLNPKEVVFFDELGKVELAYSHI